MVTAVETAIILPILLGFVGLLVVLAGGALAQMTVTSAAAQAARAASLERDPVSAISAARGVAASTLAQSSTDCSSVDVSVNAAGLRAAIGVRAVVDVTVTCLVEFNMGLPGFPDSQRLSATRSSPVDTYRGR